MEQIQCNNYLHNRLKKLHAELVREADDDADLGYTAWRAAHDLADILHMIEQPDCED